MLKTKRNGELSEADFDWLNAMLARVGGGLITNVEALDGFLTAIVVCPDLIMPSEYVRVITSGKTEDGDLVFDSNKEVERFYDALMRHYNESSRVLRLEPRMPTLAESGEEIPAGNDWAQGFLAGSHLRHDLWSEIVNDEK